MASRPEFDPASRRTDLPLAHPTRGERAGLRARLRREATQNRYRLTHLALERASLARRAEALHFPWLQELLDAPGALEQVLDPDRLSSSARFILNGQGQKLPEEWLSDECGLIEGLGFSLDRLAMLAQSPGAPRLVIERQRRTLAMVARLNRAWEATLRG